MILPEFPLLKKLSEIQPYILTDLDCRGNTCIMESCFSKWIIQIRLISTASYQRSMILNRTDMILWLNISVSGLKNSSTFFHCCHHSRGNDMIMIFYLYFQFLKYFISWYKLKTSSAHFNSPLEWPSCLQWQQSQESANIKYKIGEKKHTCIYNYVKILHDFRWLLSVLSYFPCKLTVTYFYYTIVNSSIIEKEIYKS